MNTPERGFYAYAQDAVNPTVRFRLFYPHESDSYSFDGRWTDFDISLLNVVSSDNFAMHYESDRQLSKQLLRHLHQPLKISDKKAAGFFTAKRSYLLEVGTPPIAFQQRLNFGIWWDIVFSSNVSEAIEHLRTSDLDPQHILHEEQPTSGFEALIYRNFYTDEVCIRTAGKNADLFFDTVAATNIPLIERSHIDFMEGVFEVDNYLRPSGIERKNG